MTGQLFKSGTPIQANTREARNAESKDDFVHKMNVAATEADETEERLLLCQHSAFDPDVENLLVQLSSVMRLLNKITGSSKRGGH